MMGVPSLPGAVTEKVSVVQSPTALPMVPAAVRTWPATGATSSKLCIINVSVASLCDIKSIYVEVQPDPADVTVGPADGVDAGTRGGRRHGRHDQVRVVLAARLAAGQRYYRLAFKDCLH